MTLYGDDRNNTLAGDTEIYGGNGNDRITGSASDDVYFGDDGNDIIGGAGISFTGAGRLDDPFILPDSATVSGTDTLSGGAGTDLLAGGDGDDILIGGSGNDSGVAIFQGNRYFLAGLFGGAGEDYLDGGEGNDLLDGGAGVDTLEGGRGLDVASYYFNSGIRYSLDGSDTVAGDIKDDILLSIEGISGSNSSNDILGGDEGANWLIGNGGNDELTGRSGNDRLEGGTGNDELTGDSGNDVISSGFGNDKVSGGTGSDTISFFNEVGAGYALDGSFAKSGSAATDTISGFEHIIGSDIGNDKLAGSAINNRIQGNSGDDTISGRAGNDNLSGGNGVDTLNGQSGNDILAGGDDADRLTGGVGVDTASYASDGAVAISLDDSIAEGDRLGAAIGDVLSSIENLSGSNTGADQLVGDEKANSIKGNGGADRISGQSGNDALSGGNGGDTLFGNAGNDKINGGSGNDILSGGTGRDAINGSAGSDTVTYAGLTAGVSLALDRSFAAAGAAATDSLTSIENIIGTSFADKLAGNGSGNRITGGSGRDTLSGQGGNDTLSGGDNADTLNGGIGSDTLRGGLGADRLNGGTGTDTASYTQEAAVVVALDRSITQAGAAAGDTFISIENVAGSATGSDRLAGNAFGNRLSGDGGNDQLAGKGGNDVLIGGVGADTLAGGAGSDRFTYRAIDQGNDQITDFNRTNDLLVFTGSAFGGLAAGELKALNFEIRTVAGTNGAITVNDSFVFNTATNELWFDADGFVGAATVRIASFTTEITLSAADILIV
jgi:Ca2+-binding RTX toxin-like protein